MGVHPTGNRILFWRCTLVGSLRLGRPSRLLGASGIFNEPSPIPPGTGNSLREYDDPGHDPLRQLVSNALIDLIPRFPRVESLEYFMSYS